MRALVRAGESVDALGVAGCARCRPHVDLCVHRARMVLDVVRREGGVGETGAMLLMPSRR
jgi:hypothetical protein